MRSTRSPGTSKAVLLVWVLALAALAACASSTPRSPASPAPAAATASPSSGGERSAAGSFPAHASTTASTKATLKLDTSFSRCHELYSVGAGDAKAEVTRLAQGCAVATKMRRLGEPFTGEQSAAGKPQTFKWTAKSGHCYRAYGVGAPAIKNLDLLLVDSGGVVLGQDGNDDGAPVVLDAGAICFTQDDAATLVVSVGDGSGAFAVELWSD